MSATNGQATTTPPEPPPVAGAAPPALPPADLARFVGSVFAPKDLLLVRLIETWTEGTKKRSRFVYRATRVIKAKYLAESPHPWEGILGAAEREMANVFFGVCPRPAKEPSVGGSGPRFDLAWQVRTVRVLWADLDHCTVEEALRRCEAAGLPRPSVIVNSGNGVHLYWLLGDPLPDR